MLKEIILKIMVVLCLKYCKNCGYENLDEQFECRHCGCEFEAFDWDSVERENVTRDADYLITREYEYNFIMKKLNGSVVKDWIFLLISSFICIEIIYYGFYHSWFWYWLFVIIYGCILAYEIPLFLKLFKVKLTVNVHGKDFFNYKYPGLRYILSGLTVLVLFYPFTLYNKFIGVVYMGMPGMIVPLSCGICYFLRPNTFNEYTDYSLLNGPILLWVVIENMIFGLFFLGNIQNFPIEINIIFGVLYLIILFTQLFPDVVNKYNKYDIRGPNSLYILFILFGVLILFILEYILAYFFGLLFS